MPRIAQYTAPIEKLVESTRGTAAFEQAGRRLGPLYNEAATFQKQQGEAQAQQIKDQAWPFDIAKLLASQNHGFHIGGRGVGEDKSALSGSHIGLPDNSGDQIVNGIGALGAALRDGGYAMAGSAKAPPIMTENGGNLVTLAEDTKLDGLYNTELKGLTDAAIQAQQGGPVKGVDTGTITPVDYGGNGAADAYPGYGNYGPNDQGDTSSGGGSWFSGLSSANAATSETPAPDTGGM